MNIFHLAIPTHDLDAATEFYVEALNARPARRYHDRQTFNFFGHQLVCHLDEELVPDPEPLRPPIRVILVSPCSNDGTSSEHTRHAAITVSSISRSFTGASQRNRSGI